MRIAEIVSGHAVNGAVRHCLALTRELARRGHEVIVVCRPEAWIGTQLTGDPVDVVHSDLHRWPVDELQSVARLLRKRGIDVVHTHMSCAHFFGVLLKAFSTIPVVATAHSRWLQPHWAFNDRVIAVSNAVARFHRRWNLVASGRIAVIHNFVDTRQFTPPDESLRREVRASLGIGPSTPLVGFVGSVFREKGVQDLIAAWPSVLAARPDPHLAIVGDGPRGFANELRDAIATATIQRHVSWLGQRDDVADVMGALDVLVMPSREEAAGLVALEAMAVGLPVVAAAVGGVPEYVRDGETGLLVRRGDVAGLVNAILTLLADGQMRHRYGQAGRACAEERFSPAVQVPKIEAVLQCAINSNAQ